MIRRAVVAALVGGALLMPQQVEGQILRTWCNTPAMTWCFNATAFFYASTVLTTSPRVEISWALTGYVSTAVPAVARR